MHVEISVIDQYVEKYGCVDKSALAGESVLADSLPIHYLMHLLFIVLVVALSKAADLVLCDNMTE